MVAASEARSWPGRSAKPQRRGCALVQLTTDKSRTAAHRFYERMGFVASHEGMKLALPQQQRLTDLPSSGSVPDPCPIEGTERRTDGQSRPGGHCR